MDINNFDLFLNNTEVFAQAFAFGFGTAIIAGLSAWAVSAIIRLFRILAG